MHAHVRVLADDALEGRGTGTAAGTRTTAWISERFRALGLEPEFQAVPLTGSTTTVLETSNLGTEVLVHSEYASGVHEGAWTLVDAGYGIVAPEHDWDDYAGLDVAGAVVVVKSGEPRLPGRFDDEALTVHGRWTTKLHRARDGGAAGCLIVHDRQGAGYPWSVVETSFSAERFAAVPAPMPALAVWGWLREPPGADRLTLRFEQHTRLVTERNVLARVGTGKAPFVVVTAHWDHLGTGPDGVFNGAMDNASGVASLLALADALARHDRAHPLGGTVVFAATAAEEVGLFGSEVLAASLDPREVVGAINLDGMNVGAVTETVELVAAGRSTLDDVFASALSRQGRRALPDQSPQSGAAFRSDHLAFLRRDVPVLYPQPGFTEVTDPAVLAFAKSRTRRYHTPSDDYDPTWSFEGAVADTRAIFEVVLELVGGDVRPRMLDPLK